MKYIQHKSLTLFQALALFCGAIGLSACSGMNSTADAQAGKAEAIVGGTFASLKELDYSAPTDSAKIAPADMLEIKVFQADELSGKVRVDASGKISLPLIGAIQVAGLTPIEVENRVKGLLAAKYLQDPQVTVFMESFTTQRVTVEGEVNKPGVYPIEGSASLMQAIAMGGGVTDLADPKKIVLFRRVGNQTKAYNLDLKSIQGGSMRDPYLRSDDRVVVHRSDNRFWIREVTGTIRGFVSPVL